MSYNVKTFWRDLRFDDDPSVDSILSEIMKNPNARDYTYVILGETGPNGKTALCTHLVAHGYRAVEISEHINSEVTYIRNENHVWVDQLHKTVTIMLNRRVVW